MTEPDYLAQLVEAGARAAAFDDGYEDWLALNEAAHNSYRRQISIALTAALACDLTQPCATCGGTGHVLGCDDADVWLKCGTCEGSGRVSSGARLLIGEQLVIDAGARRPSGAVIYTMVDDRPVYRDITKGATP